MLDKILQGMRMSWVVEKLFCAEAGRKTPSGDQSECVKLAAPSRGTERYRVVRSRGNERKGDMTHSGWSLNGVRHPHIIIHLGCGTKNYTFE
ncbi:hypothetical protein KFK09_005673 [Dendrobium nobile]|uniref:Uncharacterized protein n=1 Tax=Dendrobium nobile TaxID=94219 RepID=A0A8T3BZT5_DENNO|nr:hypothetical protein KFK09_005673 [Dendrobium nobile]